MKRPYNERRFVIIGIFIAVGVLFVAKLFYLQVIDDSYLVSANRNTLRYITQYPARGLIYDRNGKLLVYNEATYDLMVIPNEIKNLDTAEICNLFGITPIELGAKLMKARKYSPYRASVFEKQLSKESFGYIQEKLYRFKGFYVQSRTLRKYPRPVAAHTLGYIGEVDEGMPLKDNYYRIGDYIGISGIEKSYERELRGRKGMKIMMVDVHNREKGSFEDGKYDTTALSGLCLFSCLDADLQEYGEKLMHNKKGSIVAIEPSSGEILTIVSTPAYDPNLLVGRVRSSNYYMLMKDPENPLFNRALMAKYPPGSTFKMVNALIGLQDGVLKPGTTFSCERGFHYGKLNIACHVHASPLDLAGSIKHSCNAYYCKAFRQIIDHRAYKNTREGFIHWRNQVLSFGFGSKFNSDLPYELKGNIPSPEYYDRYHGKNAWRSLSIISLAIGQGELGITPLQLANFAAIIANGGFYYTPHVVRAAGVKENYLNKFKERKNTSIDSKYFDLIKKAMYEVVTSGTGAGSRIDSIKMCGKTGTAQNPHGKDHSLFIAFAPKDNPKIAICVVVENAGFGATWAAPIASLMIEKYLKGSIRRTDLEARILNTEVK